MFCLSGDWPTLFAGVGEAAAVACEAAGARLAEEGPGAPTWIRGNVSPRDKAELCLDSGTPRSRLAIPSIGMYECRRAKRLMGGSRTL